MDSGMGEATPQQEIDNNVASFKEMCDQCWTLCEQHRAFKEWPMGRPGPSKVSAEPGVDNARACTMRFNLVFRRGP